MRGNALWLGVLGCAIAIAPTSLRAQEPAPPLPTPSPETAPSPIADVRATRIFFAPTARSLPRGKGSVALTEVILPSVEVGLTDRVSVGGFGWPPLEDFSGGGIVLAPKVQLLRRHRVQAAIGVFQVFAAGSRCGIGYGVVTVGSADSALTVGYGYGYGRTSDWGGSPGALFIGGDKAIGRSLRLLVEGYVGGAGLGLPENTLVGGVRFSHRRFSVDLGALVPIHGTQSGSPFPLFAIAWAF